MTFNFKIAADLLPLLLDGLLTTVILLIPTFVLGLLMSIPIAIGARSKKTTLHVSCTWYTAFMRGAPQLVLLYLVYNGFPLIGIVRDTFLWGFFKEPLNCAIFVFVLNHAAFLAEIWRGALANVPKGLVEAASALGAPRWLTFVHVEMPLAFRYGLSAYRNEVILFLKATSIVGAITVFDVLGFATEAVDLTYDPFTPLVMAGIVYWCLVQSVQFTFDHLEKHLSLDRRAAA